MVFEKGNKFRFKKGNMPWSKGTKDIVVSGMKGKHHTEETKRKMSIAHKGIKNKPPSEETKKKISLALKGHKVSKEARRKISLANSGVIHSEEYKKRMSLIIKQTMSEERKKEFSMWQKGKKQSIETINKRVKRGKEHRWWKGGITSLTRKRTNNFLWKRIANKIRLRDSNTCKKCGFIGDNKKLPVHHIIPFRISKDDNPNNLMTVCSLCHFELDNKIK